MGDADSFHLQFAQCLQRQTLETHIVYQQAAAQFMEPINLQL